MSAVVVPAVVFASRCQTLTNILHCVLWKSTVVRAATRRHRHGMFMARRLGISFRRVLAVAGTWNRGLGAHGAAIN